MKIVIAFFSDDADFSKINLECGATEIFTVASFGAPWPSHGDVTDEDLEFAASVKDTAPSYIDILKDRRGTDNWMNANLETRIQPALHNLIGKYLWRKDNHT